MKDILKFEYIFAFATLIILGVALFIFKGNKDIVNIIITSIVGALSSVTAFFFTKTQVSDKRENKTEEEK